MRQKTKIGYISLFHPPDAGGGEIYLARMIHALESFDQYLWTTTPVEKISDGRFAEKCSVRSFASSPAMDYATIGKWFDKNHEKMFLDIDRWSKKIGLDLLIFNAPITYFDQVKPFIDSIKGDQPIGCILHDVPGQSFSILLNEFQKTESWEESLKKVRPQLYELATKEKDALYASPFSLKTDFTIYNSNWVKGFYDLKDERESFILHPLISRTNDLPELGLKPVDLTIVNPLPMKGAALFLALANFYFRDYKIRILGGGYNSAMAKLEPFLSPVESGFYRAEPPNNLEVLGHVENMSEVYRNTKILLHPTRIEGYGMTAVEALLENRIVITTDIPGVVEGVGDAAIKMPYYATPQNWADTISSALENEDRWRDKIEKRAKFLIDRQTKEIADLEQYLEGFVKRKG